MEIHSFRKSYIILILLSLNLFSCGKKEADKPGKRTISSPEWSRNAVIYEVNIRQYSPEGTILAVEKQLPRLKAMGVDILWLMPIHPIGELNRKGSKGSYYAVKDYLGFNPEFGTKDDFRRFVQEAHKLGMKVILDWVANHTAWDNPLTVEHPEWYSRDDDGNFVPPVTDWADVIDLDYSKPELRRYMIDALLYWVKEFDVDGYRCDVAAMVPTDFWVQVRKELDAVKPVFMLAEADEPVHQEASFDMSYGWKMHHIFNEIAKGKAGVTAIDSIVNVFKKSFPVGSTLMQFTSNHDENSWNGTEFERLGVATDLYAVLCYTLPGMPLIYSGQESAYNKRLEFFEKDPINWGTYEKSGFYAALSGLKHSNPALDHGENAAAYHLLHTADGVFAFERFKGRHSVITAVNTADEPRTITLRDKALAGEYRELFSGKNLAFTGTVAMELPAYGYQVWSK
jgi:glycosidase